MTRASWSIGGRLGHVVGRPALGITKHLPSRRCHADPPQPHGPYYQWTAKRNGTTVTRRLTDRENELYKEWIANDRQLRAVVGQMRQVAAKAGEQIIAEVADT